MNFFFLRRKKSMQKVINFTLKVCIIVYIVLLDFINILTSTKYVGIIIFKGSIT